MACRRRRRRRSSVICFVFLETPILQELLLGRQQPPPPPTQHPVLEVLLVEGVLQAAAGLPHHPEGGLVRLPGRRQIVHLLKHPEGSDGTAPVTPSRPPAARPSPKHVISERVFTGEPPSPPPGTEGPPGRLHLSGSQTGSDRPGEEDDAEALTHSHLLMNPYLV